MHDELPPAMCDRFMRCMAKAIHWRAAAIREPKNRMAAALACYWERQAWARAR